MSREQLLDVTNRLIAWINTTQVDLDALATIAAKDVVVPIPYPGSTPDYDGLVTVTQKIHEASPDFKMTFKESIVDETEKRVVFLLQCSGTQAGYHLVSDN